MAKCICLEQAPNSWECLPWCIVLRRILRPSSGSQTLTGQVSATPGLVISYPLSISDRYFMKVRTLGHIYSPKSPCWFIYTDASPINNQGKRNQIASFQRSSEQWEVIYKIEILKLGQIWSLVDLGVTSCCLHPEGENSLPCLGSETQHASFLLFFSSYLFLLVKIQVDSSA